MSPFAPATPPERRTAAELAARALGPTLVLGTPVPGLVRALLARVAPVVRLTPRALEAVVEEQAVAAADGAGFAAHPAPDVAQARHAIAQHAPGTCVLDADGWLGALATEPETWRGVDRLLVVGRHPSGPPGRLAARLAGPGTLIAAWADVGRAAAVVRLADAARYCVEVRPGATARVAGSAPATRVPVTVVIPTAGRSRWLGDAIASALAQTRPPERILVVSDGCAERVRPVVEGAGESVELLAVPAGGQAAAMNAGLRAVTTPFVAWLDDDDTFEPRKLELQVAALEARPDAVLSATSALAVDAMGRPLAWPELPEVPDEAWPRLFLGGSYLLGPTVLARVDAYRALGEHPYDETLPRAADHAMWLTLAARGPLHVLRLPLTRVRRHEGNALTPERMRGMREAARRTLAWAVATWPLEHFFPALVRASGPAASALRASAHLERAGRLLRVGLTDLALVDVVAARRLVPHDAGAAHVEGVVHLERGELDVAAEAFARAAARGAPPAEIACAQGTIAWLRGDRGGALAHFERAHATDPSLVVARYDLAIAGARDAEAVEVLELLRETLGERPLPAYLLSPDPPADRFETFLIRTRRQEAGLAQT